MKVFKIIFIIAVLLIISAITVVTAQVTIGADDAPQNFSVLELISGTNRGLRLPQLTTAQRDALALTFGAEKTGKAMGLQIFNTTIRCVETWNGQAWIEQCPPSGHYVPPIVVIPPGKGGDTWTTTKWVGAFWRDNQTGERIIASEHTGAWAAYVDDESGAGSWLTLAADGGADPKLWTDSPGDAENYQLPAARVTSVSGTGNILFRIGVTGTDSRTTSSANKYPDGSNGKAPRYAKVILTAGSTPYTIYCRQGEAADYVFTPIETYTSPQGDNGTRTYANRFSPYNLTDAALSESVTAHQTGAGNGAFTDFPTKAGAFWQWGMNTNATYAYHPTQPTGAVSGWSVNSYTGGFWDDIKNAQETCPDGWRRPNDGSTSVAVPIATDGSNIPDSEIRQSLFLKPPRGSYGSANNSLDGSAFGYYADGFFDRRPITASATGTANSAVSATTKDAAYVGRLYFNTNNGNRSLFMPAAGYRGGNTNGALSNTGYNGYLTSSASVSATGSSYELLYRNNYTSMTTGEHYNGQPVRCVCE